MAQLITHLTRKPVIKSYFLMSKFGSKIKENCVFVSHDGGELLLE